MNKPLLISLIFVSIIYSTQAQTVHINGPAGSENFGKTVTVVANGNYVITDPLYDEGGIVNVGAVYLYNGITNTLISTLKGSVANDRVGSGGITRLANGNYVVKSPLWDNGSAVDAGAITWCDGNTGMNGTVSAGNSLVGSTTNDLVGNGGVTPLSNSNFVVRSSDWNNGPATRAGAVTWCNGATGTVGTVSASNSLVGTIQDDALGNRGVYALPNGNYVVSSSYWNNGAAIDAGAVTWGNGTSGISGAVDIANSLVGTGSNQYVGELVAVLSQYSNYLAISPQWDNGSITDVGAVTWANGSTGITGQVDISNSLTGSQAFDRVGAFGAQEFRNGNYVVVSPFWANGTNIEAGAVTWGNGSTGIIGQVNITNSLVGSQAYDQAGTGGITPLSNGHYVVSSDSWKNGSLIGAGAVTWGNGTTGVSGAINSSNSLIGNQAYDRIGGGGVKALANGNYVVSSFEWDNGSTQDAGAVTWCNGTSGRTGFVDISNSLVGTTVNELLGVQGVYALPNGNYITVNYNWKNGSIMNAGAVTWADGASGITGVISSSNSLVGSSTNDQVGSPGIIVLNNGNYVVKSSRWNNGATMSVGAVTWCNGLTGRTGPVNAGNSLTGSTSNDAVGSGFGVALPNGNYIVGSTIWNNGPSASGTGAVTLGNGVTGTTGVVSPGNSLVGYTISDQVGSSQVTTLSDSYFMLRSGSWNNGALNDAGAVTLADGNAGIYGFISGCNSVASAIANAGFSLVYAYRYDQNSIIVGRPSENIVTVFKPTPLALANTQDMVSRHVHNTTTIPLITNYDCRIIATVSSAGSQPVNSLVNAKAWIESAVPTYAGQPFAARHYEIMPTTNGSNATGRITFYFTQQEFDAYNAHPASDLDFPTDASDAVGKANIRVGYYSGISSNGSGLPGSYAGNVVIIDPADNDIVWNSSANWWEISFNTAGFGGFVLQTSLNPLPLTLLDFVATINKADAVLAWKTTDETNTHHFDVERSSNGIQFTKVGKVDAANEAGNHYYDYTDRNAAINSGILYYRLGIVDVDGTQRYSRVIKLNIAGNSSISLYPNPVKNEAIIRVSNDMLTGTTATISDSHGRIVKRFAVSGSQVKVSVSDLPNGLYIVKFTNGVTTKFIKN